MPSIALVTCEKFPSLYGGEQLLPPALQRAGIAVQIVAWTDADVDWSRFDAVVLRTTWDYFERYPEFCAWLDRLEAMGARVFNPLATVRANSDKVYLQTLERLGVATVPTCWVAPGTAPAEVQRQLADLTWPEVVIKPSVSGGAFRTERLSLADLRARREPLADILADSHALVQPFLPEIASAGEWSFLYFGGTFSHSVLKQAKAGDYRVQMTHGGRHTLTTAPDELRAQADEVLRLCRGLPGGEQAWLYARVDGVSLGGRFVVVEVELIEPYLFLDEDPPAADRFAAALQRML